MVQISSDIQGRYLNPADQVAKQGRNLSLDSALKTIPGQLKAGEIEVTVVSNGLWPVACTDSHDDLRSAYKTGRFVSLDVVALPKSSVDWEQSKSDLRAA